MEHTQQNMSLNTDIIIKTHNYNKWERWTTVMERKCLRKKPKHKQIDFFFSNVQYTLIWEQGKIQIKNRLRLR